jgi:hypothetical protein
MTGGPPSEDENDPVWGSGSANIKLIELTERQLQFCGGLTDAAGLFVCAHEFGHVVINLAGPDVPQMGYGMRVIDSLFSQIGEMSRPEAERIVPADVRELYAEFKKLSDADKNNIVRHWGEELTADLIGLELCVAQEKDPMGRVRALAGVEASLIIMRIAETYCVRIHGAPRLGAHPPSHIRLDALRAVVKNTDLAAGLEVGAALSEISDQILAALI